MDKSDHDQKKSSKEKGEEDEKAEPWWRRSIVKDSAIVLLGTGIGIVLCYTWLLNQDWFVRPAIDNAVRATVAAQIASVPSAIPTVAPTATGTNQSSGLCTDYGIKITSPANGEKVRGSVVAKGIYATKPSDGSILLLLKSPAGDFFPQDPVTIDSGNKTWQGDISLGEGQNFDVIVSIMGNNGQVLYDYFNKVGKETGRWPAIRGLTDDIVECDRVTISHEE